MDPLAAQQLAIIAQKAAHAAVKNGTDSVPADVEGPLALYNRAQTLDYLAQLTVCLRDGAFLPNATGVGLTILPGTKRLPLDAATVDPDQADGYPQKIARLTEAGAYTEDEIEDAVARLDANLAAGVTLDPATAERSA